MLSSSCKPIVAEEPQVTHTAEAKLVNYYFPMDKMLGYCRTERQHGVKLLSVLSKETT